MKIATIGKAIRSIAAAAVTAPALLKKNLREAKSELQGLAISRASRVRTLKELDTTHTFFAKDERDKDGLRIRIGRCLLGCKVPVPTGLKIRMRSGHPMMYFSDGSLRHAAGRTAARSKAAFKALRMVKRRRWSKRLEATA